MGFWETVLSNVVAGSAVAIVVATLALLVTDKYASAREEEQARHERNLAAAEELYRVHGQFFAAWKAWEYHCSKATGPGTVAPPSANERLAELLADAAAAEGGYESLMVRIALEHDLTRDEMAAAWCLRVALKQLRYAIRENRPLTWWRSDIHGEPTVISGYRQYVAFKSLVSRVARILVDPRKPTRDASGESRATTLAEITGSGATFVHDPRFAPRIAAERRARIALQEQQQRAAGAHTTPGWEWVVIAEELGT